MRLRATSTHRTYRYVRLSLVGVIVMLGISVGVQIMSGGPLDSVSAAFYTPARDVFVGALCAVALALLALSGRSLEQVLLDAAALFAPVIALVPTPIASGGVSGSAPRAGGGASCPTHAPCVPDALLPGIANGLFSLGSVAVLGIAAVLVIAKLQGALDRSIITSSAVASGVVVVMGGWWMLSPTTFARGAHNVAAVFFFTLIALVAALAAWRPARIGSEKNRFRLAYGVIAGGILAALALAIAAAILSDGTTGWPLLFIGEAASLVLFGVFWIVQTIEFWNDVDPRIARPAADRSQRS